MEKHCVRKCFHEEIWKIFHKTNFSNKKLREKADNIIELSGKKLSKEKLFQLAIFRWLIVQEQLVQVTIIQGQFSREQLFQLVVVRGQLSGGILSRGKYLLGKLSRGDYLGASINRKIVLATVKIFLFYETMARNLNIS